MAITLFEEKNDRIWIKIEAYFNKDQQLVVHGCDSGKTVQELKQRYDYEYFVTVEPAAVQQLQAQLGAADQGAVLDWLTQNFSKNTAVSALKKELDALGIPYQFSTW